VQAESSIADFTPLLPRGRQEEHGNIPVVSNGLQPIHRSAERLHDPVLPVGSGASGVCRKIYVRALCRDQVNTEDLTESRETRNVATPVRRVVGISQLPEELVESRLLSLNSDRGNADGCGSWAGVRAVLKQTTQRMLMLSRMVARRKDQFRFGKKPGVCCTDR